MILNFVVILSSPETQSIKGARFETVKLSSCFVVKQSLNPVVVTVTSTLQTAGSQPRPSDLNISMMCNISIAGVEMVLIGNINSGRNSSLRCPSSRRSSNTTKNIWSLSSGWRPAIQSC